MKSVVLCGSRRFKPEIREFAKKLREKGVNVFEPHLTNFEWNKLPADSSDFVALGLTHDHFYKIRMADVVFLYNKDGYNRFAKTPHFSADDEGKARFQASMKVNSKAVESLRKKTLGFQPREAYSGVSTTLELGYAVALGKPIYALSDKDEELCRKVLIREFISSPTELIKRLK